MADDTAKVGPLLVGDRPLPHSPDAESAVLSCLLQDPATTMDVVFGKLETDQCMYVPAHRRLFACLREMRGEIIPSQIDIIAITERLERKGVLEELGGDEFLLSLYNLVPTTANVENYVSLVLDSHIMRRLIRACSEIVGRCYESGEDVPVLIDSIEEEILSITEMRTEMETKEIKELLPAALNYLEALKKKDPRMMGLPTGFTYLDDIITGLKPGEMFVLAARPSIGKTTLALNMVRHIAGAGHKVGFFSLEMGAAQVVMRLICTEAKIDIRDVRDGRLSNTRWRTDLLPACDRLKDLPIFIDDSPQLSTLELRQKARRMKREHGIEFVAIDYLQLMRPVTSNRNTSREQEVARMSREIKALAREQDIPVMLLCQLNRAAELTASGLPKLANLRESGAIEQDADVVGLLHRERQTDNDKLREDVAEGKGIETKLIIAKHRNGPTGLVPLTFFPQYTLFATPERVEDEDVPI